MKNKQASDYFHGEDGYNCAQAVLKAFQPESGMPELVIRSATVAGGGRAKGGTCGALYAAQIVLGEGQHSAQVANEFLTAFGSTLCSDIKQSEGGCRHFVGKTAEFTERHIDNIDTQNDDYVKAREIREINMLSQEKK